MLKEGLIKIYRKGDEYKIAYPYRDKYGLLVSPSSCCLEYDLRYGWSIEYVLEKLKNISLKR